MSLSGEMLAIKKIPYKILKRYKAAKKNAGVLTDDNLNKLKEIPTGLV